jgi:hypothetical protein
MSDRKKVTRAPTARSTRLREAMAAFLEHGSSRKAARATGIPYRTIGTWAASAEGKAVLAELQATVGQDRAAKIWEVADKYLARLDAEAADMPLGQVAIVYGILADKAARLAPKKAEETGDLEVHVRFGGVRVERDADGSVAEGAGAEIVVRRGGPGA